MLTLRNVRKAYGEVEVLRGVDLHLGPGEIIALMGPSGCGKSTLIRCINRLVEPDEGEILFGGEPVLAADGEALRAIRRRIGFVFQHFNLIGRLRVWENVALGAVLDGMPKEWARRKAEALLERVGLKGLADRRPDQLSGGQRQRVGIARALMNDPDLILWDEPTASLDPIRTQEVLGVMEELARERSAAMIIVTHEIPFAERVADRLVLMDEGRVVEEGEPTAILTQPRSAVGEAYARLRASYAVPSRSRAAAGKRKLPFFAELDRESAVAPAW